MVVREAEPIRRAVPPPTDRGFVRPPPPPRRVEKKEPEVVIPKVEVVREIQRPLAEKALKKETVMISTATQPPNDSRGFVHKRIIRGAIGLVTGGPTAAITGFVAGNGKSAGESAKFGGPGTALAVRAPEAAKCMWPARIDPISGKCRVFAGAQPGPDVGGQVIMGRHGAAMMPGNLVVNRAVCLRGMVVGDDGLCYNRSQISNKKRMWPRGRRPLFTGGEMRAVQIASRVATRMTHMATRLQDQGLIKKPIARRPRKKK